MKSKRKSYISKRYTRKPRRRRGKSNRTLRKKNRTKGNRKYRKIKGGDGSRGTFRCIGCKKPISVRGGDMYYTNDAFHRDGHTAREGDRPMCNDCTDKIIANYIDLNGNTEGFDGWEKNVVPLSDSERKAKVTAAAAAAAVWEQERRRDDIASARWWERMEARKTAEDEEKASEDEEKAARAALAAEFERAGPTLLQKQAAIRSVIGNPTHYGTVLDAVKITSGAFLKASQTLQKNFSINKNKRTTEDKEIKWATADPPLGPPLADLHYLELVRHV